jgi:dephospho-CoA kinase
MGAGKSVAVDFFRDLGWPVYPSDERAKKIVAQSIPIQSALVKAFGADSLLSDGIPNPSHLGIQAFSSQRHWETLNKIIHPAVQEDFTQWLTELNDSEHPWAVRESALLFEVGLSRTCDRILLITAPESVRRTRIAARNPEQIQDALYKRMSFQWDDERKRALLRAGDYEIANTGSKENLRIQLGQWHLTLVDERGAK